MLTKSKVALIILIGLSSFFVSGKIAYAHHQGDYFPIGRSNYVQMLEMERTGVWRWNYVQRCGEGNILPDVAGAFDDSSSTFKVLFLPDTSSSAQANISTCSTDFTSSCGAQAVACVGYDGLGYPRTCNAKYNGPYMATFYSFASRKSVPKHEWMHCSTRRAEDYQDDTATLTCIPSDSIMGCGPNHPLDYSQRDIAAWNKEHNPVQVASPSLWREGGVIFYGASHQDDEAIVNGVDTGRCTRVAVFRQLPGQAYQWTGQHGICSTNIGLYAIEVARLTGACYAVAAEDAIPTTWGVNFTVVGCI